VTVTGPDPTGALLFARYAYPPNALGYCGPGDSTELRGYTVPGRADDGLVRLARKFTGAWPYLELIAAGTGIADPLHRKVVEAYWVGNDLLDTASLGSATSTLAERLRPYTGGRSGTAATVLDGCVPHHSFHVLCVYPWAGMLGRGRACDKALTVLDRCRIRWGQVSAVHADHVTVRCRPLVWDGRCLSLGSAVVETADLPAAGIDLTPGDQVSLHWNWVCERLTGRQVRALRAYSQRQLDIVNRRSGQRATVAAET
jgi:hypothetical protein